MLTHSVQAEKAPLEKSLLKTLPWPLLFQPRQEYGIQQTRKSAMTC